MTSQDLWNNSAVTGELGIACKLIGLASPDTQACFKGDWTKAPTQRSRLALSTLTQSTSYRHLRFGALVRNRQGLALTNKAQRGAGRGPLTKAHPVASALL
eukprot:11567908-Alexandrium_andersonii.AAC.1